MSERILIEYKVKDDGTLEKTRAIKKEIGETGTAGKRASTGMQTFGTAIKFIGAAIAAAGVGRFMRDTVRMAAEQQRTFNTLASSMKTVGVSYNEVSGELQGLFAELQRTTRFGDTDTADVFQRLLAVTQNYDAALKLLRPTLDFATAAHIDAATAARLAGQAATGMTGTLSRYGVVLDDATKKEIQSADAMGRAEIAARELNKRFGGAARDDLQTYAAQVEQLGNYWGDFKETFGQVLISTVEGGGKFMALAEIVEFWRQKMIDLAVAMKITFGTDWSQVFAAMTRALTGHVRRFVGDVLIALKPLPDWLGGGDKASERAMKAYTAAASAFVEANQMYIAAGKDAVAAGEAFRKSLENLTAAASGTGAAVGTEDEPKTLTGSFASAIKYLDMLIARSERAAGHLGEFADQVVETGIDVTEFDKMINDLDITIIPDPEAEGERLGETFDMLEGKFSDLLGKGFMGELESFGDLWDEIWQDLAKSMSGIIGDAFEKLLSGDSGAFKDSFKGLKGNLGALIGGIGMTMQAFQGGGGGWGGALQGAMGGAMAGAYFSPLGAVIGAVVGGIIGALGKSAEHPETLIRNLGIDTGMIETRGHQGYGTELREFWIKQQQSVMRAYLYGYRQLLAQFEDESLFDLIGAMPTFSTEGWEGMGAGTLAEWLEKEFWPSAFMNMFKGAISEGLSGFGVTTDTLDQLWRELEALPGAERMAGLTQYVSSIVNLSHLMEDMSWDAILDAVGMNSMEVFLAGVEDVARGIDTLMLSMNDMSLLERAEQAQQIEQMILQVRQAEIQYLQQLKSMQDSINASIAGQIEGLYVGGLGDVEKRRYYEEQIGNIMAQLMGGDVNSPEELAQLMADLNRYISAMGSALGDSLYSDMSPWGGPTWAEWLTGILEQAQQYSNEYFEQFRDQIRTTNEELILTLRDLIDALTNFGDTVGGGDGGVAGQVPGDQPQLVGGQIINVYVSGSLAALRPIIRAEMQAAGGPGFPIN